MAMTLNDIREMDRAALTPDIVAKVLQCDPHWIRLAARQRPELLGFPVIVLGSRTKIPREAFIRFMEGRPADEPYPNL